MSRGEAKEKRTKSPGAVKFFKKTVTGLIGVAYVARQKQCVLVEGSLCYRVESCVFRAP